MLAVIFGCDTHIITCIMESLCDNDTQTLTQYVRRVCHLVCSSSTLWGVNEVDEESLVLFVTLPLCDTCRCVWGDTGLLHLSPGLLTGPVQQDPREANRRRTGHAWSRIWSRGHV